MYVSSRNNSNSVKEDCLNHLRYFYCQFSATFSSVSFSSAVSSLISVQLSVLKDSAQDIVFEKPFVLTRFIPHK